jgi:hypothetical protein
MTTTWSITAKQQDIELSNGNLTALCGAGKGYSAGASDTFILAGQRIYFEIHLDVLAQVGSTSAGIANALNTYAVGEYLGKSNNSIGYFDDGTVIRNNATIATYSVPTVGNTIGVAVKGGDMVWFSLNGVWQGADPNTFTGGIDISTLGDVAPAYNVVGTIGRTQITVNFGATAFKYPLPSGYTSFDFPPPPIVVPPHVMIWIPEHPASVTNHIVSEAGEPLTTESGEFIGWDDDGSFWVRVVPP